jgi:hypothetical protein
MTDRPATDARTISGTGSQAGGDNKGCKVPELQYHEVHLALWGNDLGSEHIFTHNTRGPRFLSTPCLRTSSWAALEAVGHAEPASLAGRFDCICVIKI